MLARFCSAVAMILLVLSAGCARHDRDALYQPMGDPNYAESREFLTPPGPELVEDDPLLRIGQRLPLPQRRAPQPRPVDDHE